MQLGKMAWFNEDELANAGISFVKDKGLILRAKKGSDQFGWGEKEDIIMSQRNASKNWWGVPRAWPEIVKYGKKHPETVGLRFVTKYKQYKYIGPELRDDQKECVQQAYEHLTVSDGWQSFFPGGILQAPAGTGKTLMALNLIAKLGQKALIIVHKEILMKQWIEQIEKCLTITDECLSIGTIQGQHCETIQHSIAIGMVQTLSKKDNFCVTATDFGLIIVDEVHRLGAKEWHKAIKHFPAKYRVGLTATPRRADGFADVFKWHIGPVMAKLGSARMEPKIIFRTHNNGTKQRSYTWKKKVNLGRLTTALAKDENRNTRIALLAIQAIKKGRMPLILSDRVAQVKFIADQLRYSKCNPLVFHGTAEKVLETTPVEDFDAVVGTYQMIKEGLDLPRLDTLICATPKVDIEQAVGRILRDHPDKKEPLVVDIIDENLPILVGFAEGRRKRYIEAYGEDCIIKAEKKKDWDTKVAITAKEKIVEECTITSDAPGATVTILTDKLRKAELGDEIKADDGAPVGVLLSKTNNSDGSMQVCFREWATHKNIVITIPKSPAPVRFDSVTNYSNLAEGIFDDVDYWRSTGSKKVQPIKGVTS